MRSLRGHVLPVFAACMTLAVGIALGSGPLQDASGTADGSSLEASNAELRDQLRSVSAARVVDAALVAGLAPRLLRDRLRGRGVTILVLPGVSGSSVTATRVAVQDAGGSVAVEVTLAGDVVDPGKKTYVGSVAASSLRGLDASGVSSDRSFALLGLVLARAYVANAKNQEFDDTATKLDSELQGAKLVTLSDEPTVRGTALVVLTPGDHGEDAVTSARNVITADLLSTLTPPAEASVVVTSSTGREAGGLLDVLSESGAVADQAVSTTNAGTSAAGSLVAVYALSAALSGTAGDFGVVNGSPVLPRALAPTDR